MLLALRQTSLSYPNDAALASPGRVLAAAGMTLVSDDARPFGLDVTSEAVADRLLDGLSLPAVRPDLVGAARHVARGWVGGRTSVPVRRLVARRA